MYTYRIIKIDDVANHIDVYFKVFNDGKKLAEDSVSIHSSSLANVPSDGRGEYVQSVVAEAAKKFMVIADVKNDFSSIIGNDYTLDGVVYETKAERQSRIELEEATIVPKEI
jgi:hypothetical protein